MSGLLDSSSQHFTKMKQFISVEDTYRFLHPDKHEYTYIDPSNRGTMSRIDYILMSRAQMQRLRSVQICVAPVPDHKAVIMCFNIRDRDRGKGYWKLNATFLKDTAFTKRIKNIILAT